MEARGPTLSELFPNHSDAQLQKALIDSKGSVEGAAELLLQIEPADTCRATVVKAGTASTVKPPPRSTSWSSLHKQSHGGGSSSSSSSRNNKSAPPSPQRPLLDPSHSSSSSRPVYIKPNAGYRAAPPSPGVHAFPSLLLGADATAPQVQQRQQQQQQPQHGNQSPCRTLFVDVATGGATSSRSNSTACTTTAVPHTACSGQQPHQQQQQQHPPGMSDLLQQLSALHSSYSADLVEEVLHNVGNDPTAAAAALLELMPPPPSHQPSNRLPGSQQQSSFGMQVAVAAPTLAPGSAPCDLTAGGESAGDAAPSTTDGGCSSSASNADDVYRALRGDAIKLSNKWQKTLRRAAATRAEGDHRSAQQLTAEARVLKEQADAAHAAAALKIEVAMNAASDLWELDLHGLHVTEALQALQQRLELLQELLQDVLLQPSSMVQGAAAASSTSGGSNSSHTTSTTTITSSSRLQVLSQLRTLHQPQSAAGTSTNSTPYSTAAGPLQRSAALQELRVVVGRGNNSSGGEASLPRAVESWLQQEQYKFAQRSGAIDVKLKRVVVTRVGG